MASTHVSILPCGGDAVFEGSIVGLAFDGPEWSVRVSLANLDDLDYLKIGHHIKRMFDDYLAEWQQSTKKKSK